MFAWIATRTGVQLPSPPGFWLKLVKATHSLRSDKSEKCPSRLLQFLLAFGTGGVMATYISLVQFTDKGIRAARQTTQRVAEWATKVQSKGVSIKQMYWTLGQYDQVCVVEARTMRQRPAYCSQQTSW